MPQCKDPITKARHATSQHKLQAKSTAPCINTSMHPHYAVCKKRPRTQRKPSTNIKAIVQFLELQSFSAPKYSPAHNEHCGISASSPAALQFSDTQPPTRRYEERCRTLCHATLHCNSRLCCHDASNADAYASINS